MVGVRAVVGMALALLALTGCGTDVSDTQFTVTVADAAPSSSVPVAVFDNRMGDTTDWARQHMGTTGPGKPYVTTVPTTMTRMIGDNSPPQTVIAGLYLPDHEKSGYYALDLTPVDGTTAEVNAPFVTYDFSWETKGTPRPTGPPLPIIVTYSEGDSGWLIDIQVPQPD